jgi:undecaprenyl-diphosphatase
MIYTIDANATHWINSWIGHSQLADRLMVWVSSVGVPILVVAVACQWWARHDRQHTRYVLLATGFSFLLGLAVNQVILLFVQRVRPYNLGITSLLIPPSSDPSFPSDHATAAFAIAAVFLLHRFRGAAAFLVAAFLISISRIYIGTHYVSDVVGGALTGVLAAAVVRWMYREGTRADRFLTGIF